MHVAQTFKDAKGDSPFQLSARMLPHKDTLGLGTAPSLLTFVRAPVNTTHFTPHRSKHCLSLLPTADLAQRAHHTVYTLPG